jgi:hypothetical protein
MKQLLASKTVAVRIKLMQIVPGTLHLMHFELVSLRRDVMVLEHNILCIFYHFPQSVSPSEYQNIKHNFIQ